MLTPVLAAEIVANSTDVFYSTKSECLANRNAVIAILEGRKLATVTYRNFTPEEWLTLACCFTVLCLRYD